MKSIFRPAVPGRKTWWAKQINESLYVSGRLTDRQIKYAAEEGFASIISVFDHPREGRFGSQVLPATSIAKATANNLADIKFEVLKQLDADDEEDDLSWCSEENIKRVNELYEALPKPVIVASTTGYAAAFLALSSMVQRTKLGKVPSDGDKLSAKGLFQGAATLGYDYANNDTLRRMVDVVSKGDDVKSPAKPNLSIPHWYRTYWWLKPVHNNWYVSGQIHTDQVDLIKGLGIGVVLNLRPGVTTDGRKTQEEVTLLNIGETSTTYAGEGRQTTSELEHHRLDVDKPAAYVGGDVNYESRNALEFGDDVGYNEQLEREAVMACGIHYVHTPIEWRQYETELCEKYEPIWKDVNNKGNVLSQCRIGHRASVASMLTLGKLYHKDPQWALDKLWSMGYRFTNEDDADVIALLEHALVNKSQ